MAQPLLNTVLGTANLGEWGAVTTAAGNIQDYLSTFSKFGFHDLDTARSYGTSENVIGNIDAVGQGFKIDTKIKSFEDGAHSEERVKKSFQESLDALKVKKVQILYLHSPDRATPFEETLKAINDIYQTGAFEKFGISNYKADEVESIVEICKKKNYVLPTVYQGSYNAVDRSGEGVLFPVLRKYGIAFYAFSPLAGGFFTQKKDVVREGSRFDTKTMLGQLYAGRYFTPAYFTALEKLEKSSQGIGLIEIAIRWLYHNSELSSKYGDAVVIGASRSSQIESTIEAAKKGPLPKEIVDAINEIWSEIVKETPPPYYTP